MVTSTHNLHLHIKVRGFDKNEFVEDVTPGITKVPLQLSSITGTTIEDIDI